MRLAWRCLRLTAKTSFPSKSEDISPPGVCSDGLFASFRTLEMESWASWRIMNQLQALAMNEGKTGKHRLSSADEPNQLSVTGLWRLWVNSWFREGVGFAAKKRW